MKCTKKLLSAALVLVLALALAVPAFAESVTIGNQMYMQTETTFSDIVSQETITGKNLAWYSWEDKPLITVKVGTTLTVNSMFSNPNGRTFYEAFVKEDGSYDSSREEKSFNTGVADGTPYTLTEANIGLWYFPAGDYGQDYYLKVIANDGSTPSTPAQPEQPSTPAQPEQPSTPAQPEQPSTPAQPEQPSTPAQPDKPAVVVPEGALVYTVAKGDTWGHLALNSYGTYGVWKQLRAANKGVTLKAGAEIVLPATLGKSVRLPGQVLAEGEAFYTVQAGDTLGMIAANYYGNIKRYADIFERNSDRLTSANLIYEGQVLVLPAK